MSLIADALRAAERERAARTSREDADHPEQNAFRVRAPMRMPILGPIALAALTAAATAGLIIWLRNRSA